VTLRKVGFEPAAIHLPALHHSLPHYDGPEISTNFVLDENISIRNIEVVIVTQAGHFYISSDVGFGRAKRPVL
jgi:hypothetical protein